MTAAIVDTGPLVAFLDATERAHGWVVEQVRRLETPLLVCEAVLAEAMYLLRRFPEAQDGLFALLRSDALMIAFSVEDHVDELRQLHRKYRDRPMSFADACIVRMAEIHDRHAVFTLDSDFTVYRKGGRAPMDVIHPGAA